MGNIAHQVRTSYIAGAGSVTYNFAITNAGEANVITMLSPGATNIEQDVAFTVSQLAGLAIQCVGDVTVKVYSGATLGATITLAAGVGIIYPSAATASAAITASSAITTVTKITLSSTAGGLFTWLASINTGA